MPSGFFKFLLEERDVKIEAAFPPGTFGNTAKNLASAVALEL